MTILTVTLNPAVDVTYRIPALDAGTTISVTEVRTRAGGKGVNVASVVRALGGDSLVLAFTGVGPPDEFRAGLDELGLDHRLVPALSSVRRTVAVVADDGTTTNLREAGAEVAIGAEAGITAALRTELDAGAAAVVVSGSVPPGLAAEVPARLVAVCAEYGVPVIADVSGAALRAVATAAAVLMPNRDELAQLLGTLPRSAEEVVAAGRRLVRDGAAAIVATAGEDGAIAVTPAGAWSARPVEAVTGNPTGAGDAGAAALARHLAAAGSVSEVDWPGALADVVATSSAGVRAPVAGEIDAEARSGWLGAVTVREAG
ncbi:hexose kinase [Amycolatopsis sp. NPDC051045]|uniref:1-phosphofructokinase family hexose kinase n=1 Tax=Amycolatopsis sp. NPDC051045 TaxID=3156922 RepID=UPI0034326837